MLTDLNNFSRLLFAFSIKYITAKTIIRGLLHIFDIFGNPVVFHSDYGAQPESQEFNSFFLEKRIAKSCTSPYHPQDNGQNERYIGVIWKANS